MAAQCCFTKCINCFLVVDPNQPIFLSLLKFLTNFFYTYFFYSRIVLLQNLIQTTVLIELSIDQVLQIKVNGAQLVISLHFEFDIVRKPGKLQQLLITQQTAVLLSIFGITLSQLIIDPN